MIALFSLRMIFCLIVLILIVVILIIVLCFMIGLGVATCLMKGSSLIVFEVIILWVLMWINSVDRVFPALLILMLVLIIGIVMMRLLVFILIVIVIGVVLLILRALSMYIFTTYRNGILSRSIFLNNSLLLYLWGVACSIANFGLIVYFLRLNITDWIIYIVVSW